MNAKRKGYLGGLAILILTLILSACTQTPPTVEPAEPLTGVEPTEEETILRGLYRGPSMLNPHLASANVELDFGGIFYEPLATVNREGDMIPVLAVEIPTLDNGGLAQDHKSVTWKLREGITWHDGEPFTSEDVIFTYNYIMNPDVPATSKTSYQSIESIEAIDDYTVKVNFGFSNPAWYVPFVGFHGMVLPQHVFADYAGANALEAPGNTAPVGTGAYIIEEYTPGELLNLEAYPDYWQEGKPHINHVRFRDYGQIETAIRAVLQTGEAEFIAGVNVEWKVIEDLLREGKGDIELNLGACVERVLLNWTDPNIEDPETGERSSINYPHPFFSDLKVREAFSYTVDRATIASELYGAKGEPTANILTWPAQFASPNTSWSFDLEKAAALLDEAGWVDSNGDGIRDKDGIDMSVVFQTQTNAIRQQTQQIIKQALESIGVEVELVNIAGSSFFSSDPQDPNTFGHFYADMEEYNNCNFSLDPTAYMEGWTTEERAQASNSWAGRNHERYSNPEYDALLEHAKVELDPDKRAQLFWAMNDMLVQEDYSVIPIVTRKEMMAYSNSLKGYAETSTPADGVFWSIENWYLED